MVTFKKAQNYMGRARIETSIIGVYLAKQPNRKWAAFSQETKEVMFKGVMREIPIGWKRISEDMSLVALKKFISSIS